MAASPLPPRATPYPRTVRDAEAEAQDVRIRASMSEGAVQDDVPDAALMAGIARGDALAFTELFRRRRGGVYRFALHMTGSPAAADDVTQDVFLAVMHEAARFDPGRGTVAGWLCGVTRNIVRRRLEREREFAELPGHEAPGTDALPAVVDDPVGAIERARRVETLQRAVLSLPVRYREVVVLCDLQEASYAEAAAALDCAIGTVRSRLARGRGLLAAKLAAMDRRRADPTRGRTRSRRCFA